MCVRGVTLPCRRHERVHERSPIEHVAPPDRTPALHQPIMRAAVRQCGGIASADRQIWRGSQGRTTLTVTSVVISPERNVRQ